MRGLIFWLTFGVSLISWAGLQRAPQKFFLGVNPNGSFLNLADPGVPTVLNINSVEPGTLIYMKRKGGFSYGVGAPDNGAVSLIGVFVDASGNFIQYGSRTTAAPATLPPSDNGQDFDVDSCTDGCLVEVPMGAVAIKFGPNDDPVTDNSDANGDYGVDLEYPFIRHKFIQDWRENYDYQNDGKIDIIAGEPLQIEVELWPGLDVTNSKIFWGTEELTPPLGKTVVGPDGKISFLIGNVPDEPTGDVPVTILIKNIADETIAQKVVNVSVMPFKHIIYQVIADPDLDEGGGPDGSIDLVIGKNADVVVRLLPNMNVAQSKVIFDGVNGTSKEYPFSGTMTDGEGVMTFQIDPIPVALGYEGKLSLRIQLRDSAGHFIAEKLVPVDLRKTKPIRLGFVPISGCGKANDCFGGAFYQDAADFALKGSELTKATYPVADADFNASYIASAEAFATNQPGRYGIYQDFEYMEKSVFKGKLGDGSLTHIFGVVTTQYFTQHHRSYFGFGNTTVGFSHLYPLQVPLSPADIPTGGIVAIVAYNHPITLPHELGHLMSLVHHSDTADGYSNYDNQIWGIPRGKALGKTNFMWTMSPPPISPAPDYWISKDDYLKIFKRNLVTARSPKTASTAGLRISGGFVEDGSYRVTNVYMVDRVYTNQDETGSYIADVLDHEKNIISSLKMNASYLSEGSGELLSFEVPIPISAMYVELYKLAGSAKTKIGTIVIPADIIQEEIKYIPLQAIVGQANLVLKSLNLAVKKYRDALLKQQFKVALSILNDEILVIINEKITDNLTRTSYLSAGRYLLNQISTTSLLRVLSVESVVSEPANEFLMIETKSPPTAEGRSEIGIKVLKKIEGNASEFTQKVWFDGVEVPIKTVNNEFVAVSPRLSTGSHQWNVQNFIISSASRRAIYSSISSYSYLNYQLEKEYASESDPELKQVIADKIQRNKEHIVNLKAQLNEALIPIGNPVQLNVEGL